MGHFVLWLASIETTISLIVANCNVFVSRKLNYDRLRLILISDV
jgi:hypothetical protein